MSDGGKTARGDVAIEEEAGVGLEGMGTYGTYGLYSLVRPGGSKPVPAVFDEAEAAFERGRIAYEEKAYRAAAEAFMDAARRLRIARGEPYWETFVADRMWSYRNAASAWAMADALDEARRALGAAIEEDADCAEPLAELLAHLPTAVPAR
jgi:hypothetical protein